MLMNSSESWTDDDIMDRRSCPWSCDNYGVSGESIVAVNIHTLCVCICGSRDRIDGRIWVAYELATQHGNQEEIAYLYVLVMLVKWVLRWEIDRGQRVEERGDQCVRVAERRGGGEEDLRSVCRCGDKCLLVRQQMITARSEPWKRWSWTLLLLA